jgi:hypothetical protein
MFLSSLYLIQRFVEAVDEDRVASAVASFCLCLVMIYNVWLIIVILIATTLRTCCKNRESRFQHFFLSLNQQLVHSMAARIFGIDHDDTDGGDLVQSKSEGGYEKDLSNRMERMESMLSQLLLSKDNPGGVDLETFHESFPSRAY